MYFVLDYESLYRVLSCIVCPNIYLVNKAVGWYLEFDGGSVFISSFNVKRDRILSDKFDFKLKLPLNEVSISDFNVFELSRIYLSSGQSSYSTDLDFLFLKDGKSWLSNGYSVIRSVGFDDIKTAIRGIDISLLCRVLPDFKSFKIGIGENDLYFVTPNVTVFLPKCKEEFPISYRDVINENNHPQFKLDIHGVYDSLYMFSKLYNISGVASFSVISGDLWLEVPTNDNVVSRVKICGRCDNLTETVLYFGIDNALASLRCIKDLNGVDFYLSGEYFSVYNRDVKVVVLGTSQMVRSVMGKLVG
jgi:hypothetical protein